VRYALLMVCRQSPPRFVPLRAKNVVCRCMSEHAVTPGVDAGAARPAARSGVAGVEWTEGL
jgi:hypothetical protein